MEMYVAEFMNLGQMLSDFNLIVKIFVMMTVVSFVNNHIENKQLGMVIMVFMFFFIFGNFWAFFGGVYLIYILLMMGVSGIMVDWFFLGGGAKGQQKQKGGIQNEISGADMVRRRAGMQANMARMAGGAGGPPMRRPGG